jgi:Fur family transcriptional regulator, stress-responsive regulator
MSPALESQLRDRGLRVTAPRVSVLAVLAEHIHVSADTVAAAARERAGAVSTQGIYNVLTDLVAAGLVHRIEPAGSAALYELSGKGTHHHLICRDCGRVTDLDCEHGTESCLQPPNTHGYTGLEAEIVFWGTCPECQANPA